MPGLRSKATLSPFSVIHPHANFSPHAHTTHRANLLTPCPLLKVGLEFLLPVLNYYGYLEVSDLRDLRATDIKLWSPLLKYQPGAVERLGQLIRAERDWIKENCLPVTPAFVQDVFLAKYVGRAGESTDSSRSAPNLSAAESKVSAGPAPPRPRIRRQSSFELQVEKDKRARQKVRSVLSGDDGQSGLRARIFRKGHGLISRWQLRHLVSLYNTAESALDNACFFVRPRDRKKLLRDLDEHSPVLKSVIALNVFSCGHWCHVKTSF